LFSCSIYRKSILKKYLKPENGIPSSDTILRVLARIDAKQLEKVSIDYAREAFGKKLPENEGKKALETAKTMLAMGYPLANICKISGLSKAEVKDLRNSRIFPADEGEARGKSLGLAEGKSLGLAEGKSLGIAEGKSLGLAEGKSLGLAEGSHQKALETARILKQLGDSVQKIVQATGLTQAEVEALN